MSELKPEDIVRQLGMSPHPEGGFYVETWRSPPAAGQERSAGTAIYFLLTKGQRSHWHRVDAAEIWHFYRGAPLELSIWHEGAEAPKVHRLGNELTDGVLPQVVVPPDHWQQACSTGAWTLVGCTVSPGFEFSGFEMAPPGWEPGHPVPSAS